MQCKIIIKSINIGRKIIYDSQLLWANRRLMSEYPSLNISSIITMFKTNPAVTPSRNIPAQEKRLFCLVTLTDKTDDDWGHDSPALTFPNHLNFPPI